MIPQQPPKRSPERDATLETQLAATMTPGEGDTPGRTHPHGDDISALALRSTTDASGSSEGEPPPERAADPALRKRVLAGLFSRHRDEPTTIDRFPILSQLGAGAMGVVYSSYDEELDRRLAIKLVLRRDAGRDDAHAKRLLREAKAMAKLDHPNVARVYQAGISEQGTFIAMEFIRGQTLADWIADPQRRAWREVVDVFIQAGRGLAAAHAADIIHRDFKPANVMIDESGTVKVLDFGLARTPSAESDMTVETDEAEKGAPATASAQERLTRTGAIMGTPAYMSPEQHEGRPATAASDQFGFCAALYEGLYGQLPFPCDSLMELVSAALEGRVLPPPPGHRVPPWVHQLLLRGLSVDPARRHPSMATLLDALARDPAERRRRLLGLGAAFAAIGVSGFALAGALRPPAESIETCPNAQNELAALWGAERRAEFERSLLRAGVAYAPEVWERVAPQLDAYASSWVAMRQEACETHLAERQSDALFDRRTACLDQRRAGLATLVEQLRAADAELVEKAPIAVANLPPIEFCGDAEAMLADIRPPEDPAVAAEVQRLRERLAQARAHEQLGQYARGLELASGAVTRARELEYTPLEAEALLRMGSLQMDGAQPQEAEATLTSAMLAGITAGHPEIVAEAMSKRMMVRGEWLRQAERALEDAPTIAAYLDQRPGGDRLRGVYLNDLAALRFRTGDNQRALETYDRSLALKRAAFGEAHPEVAFTLTNMAAVHRERGDLETAARLLAEARELCARALGASHVMTLLIESKTGRVLLERGELARARPLLERALAGLELNLGPSAPRLGDTLMYIGELELHAGRFDRARDALERAVKIAESAGGPVFAIEPLHLLGQALIGTGDTEGGLERSQEAHRRMREAFGAESEWTAESRFKLGQALERATRRREALAEYRGALAVLDQQRPAGDLTIARLLLGVARVSLDLGDAPAAERPLLRALQILEGEGLTSGPELAEGLALRRRARLDR